MKKFVTIGYSYNELNDAAKEKVKRWYLEDETRSQLFYEDIIYYLKENFPRSELAVTYSLGYCQGDGLNIYGRLNMFDFLDKWATDIDARANIENILNNCDHWYNFNKNNHYCYSCKFIDRKYIDEDVCETIGEVREAGISENNIDGDLIKTFFISLIDYFEELDKKFENDGYKYLYEVDDTEVQECCEANDWYFTESGEFIG